MFIFTACHILKLILFTWGIVNVLPCLWAYFVSCYFIFFNWFLLIFFSIASLNLLAYPNIFWFRSLCTLYKFIGMCFLYMIYGWVTLSYSLYWDKAKRIIIHFKVSIFLLPEFSTLLNPSMGHSKDESCGSFHGYAEVTSGCHAFDT